MEEVTNKSHPSTFDELIDGLEKGDFKHLQIFLYRQKPSLGFVEDSKYLVIDNNGFALYKLRNLDYRDGKIHIEFIDPDTGNPAIVRLDIHETHPDLFIVNWEDVVDMVYADRKDTFDELLELGSD